MRKPISSRLSKIRRKGIVPAEIRAAILLSDRDRLLAEESRAIADLYEAPVVRRHRFPSERSRQRPVGLRSKP